MKLALVSFFVTVLFFCFYSGCTTSSSANIKYAHALQLTDFQNKRLRLEKPKAQRRRPLIAFVADNDGTETTDLLVPYGILKEANIADLIIVSPRKAIINLMPALELESQMTLKEFDAKFPEGADLIVVPALHNDKNKDIIAWIARQYQLHSSVAAICEGAWLVARAEILDGKQATTHWYALPSLAKEFPKIHLIKNLRYVIDDNVMTTTGVTASIPAAIEIVKSIAGDEGANSIRSKYGFENIGLSHRSDNFQMTATHYQTVIKNLSMFWNYEKISIEAYDGIDEVTLALTADAWSRTYKSRAYLVGTNSYYTSKSQLHFKPTKPFHADLTFSIQDTKPRGALEKVLFTVRDRYGTSTAKWVADQLEYGNMN